uniref:Uncharacterized protein n=1 Tax=Lates calcarifer TaxID=8187 RepID=A0A4W6C9Q0_LATCA
ALLLSRHQNYQTEHSSKANITGAQRQALSTLSKTQEIVIKPTDKGEQIVLQNRFNYLLEAERQLNNTTYYVPLEQPLQLFLCGVVSFCALGAPVSLFLLWPYLYFLQPHQREYWECSILVFTETWLTTVTPDTNAALDRFHLVRADRTTESGKRKGGGKAVFVNDRWCNSRHITIKKRLYHRDTELLAVSRRPCYLLREFSHVIVIASYIPPSANANDACDVLHSVVSVTVIADKYTNDGLILSQCQ